MSTKGSHNPMAPSSISLCQVVHVTSTWILMIDFVNFAITKIFSLSSIQKYSQVLLIMLWYAKICQDALATKWSKEAKNKKSHTIYIYECKHKNALFIYKCRSWAWLSYGVLFWWLIISNLLGKLKITIYGQYSSDMYYIRIWLQGMRFKY